METLRLLLLLYLVEEEEEVLALEIKAGEFLQFLGAVATMGEALGWPLLHKATPSKLRVRDDGVMEGGVFKPMMRFVTLLAVTDIGGSSSKGEGRVFSAELSIPKLNFHLDAFLEATGTGGGIMGKGGAVSDFADSPGRFNDGREALLILRAKS